MSSINRHYTFNYSQPDSYHFSHDSVFLARWAFEHLRQELKSDWQILDLCAGCGIVGMDFIFHCQKELQFAPKSIDFLEIQDAYDLHFEANKAQLELSNLDIRYLKQNYNKPLKNNYDLILCNPPYFKANEGPLSPNDFKNRCRFFIDASHEELLVAIENALKPSGRAFVLSRSKKPPTTSKLTAQIVGDIRGTPLICYQRTKKV